MRFPQVAAGPSPWPSAPPLFDPPPLSHWPADPESVANHLRGPAQSPIVGRGEVLARSEPAPVVMFAVLVALSVAALIVVLF